MPVATSRAQLEASRAGTPPGLELVADDLWVLGIPMPGGDRQPYSLAYLVRDADGGIHVIDPGWDTPENRALWGSTLAALGGSVAAVRSITATHLHPDYLGSAAWLRDVSGAGVQVHSAEAAALAPRADGDPLSEEEIAPLDEWGVPAGRRADLAPALARRAERPTIPVARALADGERLDIPGAELVVLHTPGHTGGSLSIRDDRRSVLFTGDHVLPTTHAGIGLGARTASNPLADYLASLERVGGYDGFEVLPGHGYRFRGLGDRVRKTARHHLQRSREVAEVRAAHPEATIWDIASRVTWSAGWDNLAGSSLLSALSQTATHEAFVRAGGLEGLGPEFFLH